MRTKEATGSGANHSKKPHVYNQGQFICANQQKRDSGCKKTDFSLTVDVRAMNSRVNRLSETEVMMGTGAFLDNDQNRREEERMYAVNNSIKRSVMIISKTAKERKMKASVISKQVGLVSLIVLCAAAEIFGAMPAVGQSRFAGDNGIGEAVDELRSAI
jgi:hypothetical protein